VNREGAEVTSAGRAFQTRAPATGYKNFMLKVRQIKRHATRITEWIKLSYEILWYSN